MKYKFKTMVLLLLNKTIVIETIKIHIEQLKLTTIVFGE